MTTESKPDLGEAIYRAALVLGVGASAEEFGGLKELAVHMDAQANRVAHALDGIAEALRDIATVLGETEHERFVRRHMSGG